MSTFFIILLPKPCPHIQQSAAEGLDPTGVVAEGWPDIAPGRLPFRGIAGRRRWRGRPDIGRLGVNGLSVVAAFLHPALAEPLFVAHFAFFLTTLIIYIFLISLKTLSGLIAPPQPPYRLFQVGRIGKLYLKVLLAPVQI